LGSDATKKSSFFTSSDKVTFLLQETVFRQIFEVPEYRFDDMRPDDRVIDIGANVGAFCIRASRCSPSIVAVEPVTASLLRQNIQLNGVPVRVIEGALGDGYPKKSGGMIAKSFHRHIRSGRSSNLPEVVIS
jgi:ribosomal protein L11 methylase PrmA